MDEHLKDAISAAITSAIEASNDAAEERAQPDELDVIFAEQIVRSLARSGYHLDSTMANQKLAAQYPLTYDINLNRLTFFCIGLMTMLLLSIAI